MGQGSLGNAAVPIDTGAGVKKRSWPCSPIRATWRIGQVEGQPGVHISGSVRPALCRVLAEYSGIEELEEHYKRGGLGDVKGKRSSEQRIAVHTARPIRERRHQWEQDIPGVCEILRKGSEEAERTAAQALKEIRASMKINYFIDAALIEQHRKYMAK